MASNELVDFDYSYDYFNHTKFCPLCQNRKTLKVPLAFFHLDCRCKLTEEEKKPCNFSCTRCRWLNEVGVEKLYAQYIIYSIYNSFLLRVPFYKYV